jgi:hypothetical protein
MQFTISSGRKTKALVEAGAVVAPTPANAAGVEIGAEWIFPHFFCGTTARFLV